MSNARIVQLLEEANAIITSSHVVYTKGDHGPAYVNKDLLFVYPRVIREICDAMAAPFLNDGIEAVAGPTIGGVILANRVAESLTTEVSLRIASVFAEVPDQFPGRSLNRGGVTVDQIGEVPRLVSLVDVKMDRYAEDDCPLCKAGVPINTQVGKGKAFLERKKQEKK